ncbi:hypothetical protein KMZ29_26195 [Bradyrhizobium sediminis]|uniref:Uncharacterized protein n=1 Tax=Bradyrhizobium sediminis TaxID=2840469 RepID=A0A975NDI8_9BRAD|nr:hypothetical protein [Bradyrhizobium sediminis]QWG13118.1 hypothetical protein KMZ29_26195 [Bradyrhizobium sediminis]
MAQAQSLGRTMRRALASPTRSGVGQADFPGFLGGSTTTISGQISHSLKLSFGFRSCSSSGVSGCTPFAAKNCRGSAKGGGCFWLSCSGAARCGFRTLADAASAREAVNATAANVASSFERAAMNDPSREETTRLGRVQIKLRSWEGGHAANGVRPIAGGCSQPSSPLNSCSVSMRSSSAWRYRRGRALFAALSHISDVDAAPGLSNLLLKG